MEITDGNALVLFIRQSNSLPMQSDAWKTSPGFNPNSFTVTSDTLTSDSLNITLEYNSIPSAGSAIYVDLPVVYEYSNYKIEMLKNVNADNTDIGDDSTFNYSVKAYIRSN